MIKNNDVLRRIRFIFDFGDSKMIELFSQGGHEVSRAQISDWLKKDDDPAYKELYDNELSVFLNGLIINNRGRKEGPLPKPEKRLNNNTIFRKLIIALNLKNDEVLGILELVNMKISKHELSAFFRDPKQNQYRPCKDQILRNFLQGLQLKFLP